MKLPTVMNMTSDCQRGRGARPQRPLRGPLSVVVEQKKKEKRKTEKYTKNQNRKKCSRTEGGATRTPRRPKIVNPQFLEDQT